MSDFDFVFSLFALLLGLGLAEVLGGFGIAIQHRRKIRIGWLTPLLGALVALDLTSFWLIAWGVREQVSADYASLLSGLIVIGLYYFVAKVTFPDEPGDWPDYDVYYFEHRKWVLGGVVACNLIALATLVSLGLQPLQSAAGIWSLVLFIPALFAAIFVRDKRVNVVLLLVMIVQYPVTAVLAAA